MQEVLINVYTEQVYSSHSEQNTQIFKGNIAYKGNSIYIIYTEKDEHEGTKVTNQIKIGQDGDISVRRMGSAQSFISFIKDKPYKSIYGTPQGNIELIFIPSIVEHKITNSKHTLKLQYDIYMNDDKLSNNTYCIQVM